MVEFDGALEVRSAARAREIATLRAIGFGGLPVVAAVMLETMLLALIGGLIGGLLAWLIFNGQGASTLAGGSVGKLSFDEKKLAENIHAFIHHVLAIKPNGVKGQYIKGVTLSGTMTPGIQIAA